MQASRLVSCNDCLGLSLVIAFERLSLVIAFCFLLSHRLTTSAAWTWASVEGVNPLSWSDPQCRKRILGSAVPRRTQRRPRGTKRRRRIDSSAESLGALSSLYPPPVTCYDRVHGGVMDGREHRDQLLVDPLEGHHLTGEERRRVCLLFNLEANRYGFASCGGSAFRM